MSTSIFGDLNVELVGDEHGPGTPLVVLLHGYDGFASDLSPFARSLGLPLCFAFPEAPLRPGSSPRGGHAFWPIDDEGRAEAIARGEPRDLSDLVPAGLAAARERLERVLDELDRTLRPRSVILGGFSQGAMLSCDLALRSGRPLSGLVLLSGARICATEWSSLYERRRGLPVFITHGRADPDLAFHAAERLSEDLAQGGLDVTWLPVDAGHEVTLLALRGLKRFLAAHATPSGR